MRLLLDTHIWLWSHLSPDRLSRRVTRELNRPDNERWLSPVSISELVLLVEKGRVVLDLPIEKWLEQAFNRAPTTEASLTNSVAVEMLRVNLCYRDPADRLLAATARVFDLILVTADQRLIQSRQARVLANL
jgi:PIN domain nuclease of toxin-antitoxin system